jgi:hypothetical protein
MLKRPQQWAQCPQVLLSGIPDSRCVWAASARRSKRQSAAKALPLPPCDSDSDTGHQAQLKSSVPKVAARQVLARTASPALVENMQLLLRFAAAQEPVYTRQPAPQHAQPPETSPDGGHYIVRPGSSTRCHDSAAATLAVMLCFLCIVGMAVSQCSPPGWSAVPLLNLAVSNPTSLPSQGFAFFAGSSLRGVGTYGFDTSHRVAIAQFDVGLGGGRGGGCMCCVVGGAL